MAKTKVNKPKQAKPAKEEKSNLKKYSLIALLALLGLGVVAAVTLGIISEVTARASYTIDFSGEHCTATIDKKSYHADDIAILTLTAENAYRLSNTNSDISVNGAYFVSYNIENNESTSATLKIRMKKENAKVDVVTYADQVCNISVASGQNCSLADNSDANKYHVGDIAEVGIKADNSYHLPTVYDGSNLKFSDDTSCKFISYKIIKDSNNNPIGIIKMKLLKPAVTINCKGISDAANYAVNVIPVNCTVASQSGSFANITAGTSLNLIIKPIDGYYLPTNESSVMIYGGSIDSFTPVFIDAVTANLTISSYGGDVTLLITAIQYEDEHEDESPNKDEGLINDNPCTYQEALDWIKTHWTDSNPISLPAANAAEVTWNFSGMDLKDGAFFNSASAVCGMFSNAVGFNNAQTIIDNLPKEDQQKAFHTIYNLDGNNYMTSTYAHCFYNEYSDPDANKWLNAEGFEAFYKGANPSQYFKINDAYDVLEAYTVFDLSTLNGGCVGKVVKVAKYIHGYGISVTANFEDAYRAGEYKITGFMGYTFKPNGFTR